MALMLARVFGGQFHDRRRFGMFQVPEGVAKNGKIAKL
jgi:hypothetical protein